ncbi:hypothetical protein [Actinoplanes sp. CA-252034]|uniref:hypothetical protein n=1 Tax=Actinoplanes sp. CA-252034 TaxID=3239906 RepID=UPI003D963DF5
MTSPEEWSEMDRETADRLLRGDRAGHPLDRVLAAATAPATARELAGEADVMAAFRAAGLSPAPRRRSSLLRSAVARLLTLKVAVVALGTSATIGGVALAANPGALPGPPGDDPPVVSTAASRTAPETPGQAVSTVPQPAATPTIHRDRVAELCQEFTLHDRDTRTRALNDGRFGELVRRAGDKDRERVEQFCGARPRNSPGGSTYSPRPGYPDRPDYPDQPGGYGDEGDEGQWSDDGGGQRPDGDGDQWSDGDGGQWLPKPRPSASASPSSSSRPRR